MEKEELIELQVSGMHCNNCALSVHKLLRKKGAAGDLCGFCE
jgi:Cu+-exporting ATPase